QPAPAADGWEPNAAAPSATASTVESPADPVVGSQPAPAADGSESNAEAPADTATSTATSTTGESAGSAATATQQQPINVIVIVRVNSPGNDGPITQNNITVASSTAANNA